MAQLFEIGKIVKTQGYHGRVKVRSYLTHPEGLLPRLEAISLQGEKMEMRRLLLRGYQLGRNCLFLTLEGVADFQAASALVGCRVFADMDMLLPLPEDEYYWHELIGMDVVTEEGLSLGKIAEIISTGSNDVYVCRSGKDERMLPAIADVILTVDKVSRVVTVRLLDGL